VPRSRLRQTSLRGLSEIFAEHTAIIEPLSLDETYLDVTENPTPCC